MADQSSNPLDAAATRLRGWLARGGVDDSEVEAMHERMLSQERETAESTVLAEYIGGVRWGWYNATVPLAKLQITTEGVRAGRVLRR